jgi:hypothetical protein
MDNWGGEYIKRGVEMTDDVPKVAARVKHPVTPLLEAWR